MSIETAYYKKKFAFILTGAMSCVVNNIPPLGGRYYNEIHVVHLFITAQHKSHKLIGFTHLQTHTHSGEKNPGKSQG